MLVRTNTVVKVTNLTTGESINLVPSTNTDAAIMRLIKSARKDIAIVKGLRPGRIWPRYSIFANDEYRITASYDMEEGIDNE